jgi:hypothetical protein
LRRKHQALQKEAAIEPAMSRQCSVRCEYQPHWRIEENVVAASLARPRRYI